MVLGLSQCKKKVDTIATPSDLGKTVHITVNVGDGDKHQVFPNTGAVVYTDGDVIYVGDGSKYLGTLTYGSGAFSGNIDEPGEDVYLHFYFVGGLETTPNTLSAGTTSYTVSIADQSSKLPVLSYGRSTQKYTNGNATYGCTLLNKCGLVKFNLSTATDKAVTVSGLYTTATINFASAQEGITPEGTTGAVTLRNEGTNSERWAILLPQAAINNPTVTIAGFSSSIATLPQTSDNTYNNTGVNITNSASGSLHGVFTVASGKTVKFSQGNLQYQATTNTWQFAENQYDYVGDAAGNTAPSASQSGWIDLFGWGTSGISEYEPIATCYQPWSTSTFNAQYNPYGSTSTNLYDGGANAGKADWGYNAISNGGNTAKLWRTLTSAEWAYLFNGRSEIGIETRFAKATVNSKTGVIIFPDNYTHPSGVTQPTNINGYTSNYTGNSYDATQWSSMESAGAVFLPAAGYRGGSSVHDVGSCGSYWSSANNGSNYAYGVYFNASSLNPQEYFDRYRGNSVRLVCQVDE